MQHSCYAFIFISSHKYFGTHYTNYVLAADLSDIPVHIANILYIPTDTTDSHLKWIVNIAITEPPVAETLTFFFSVDGSKVKLDVGSNKIIDLNPSKDLETYSFSVYNDRGNPKTLYVIISHNGYVVHREIWSDGSQTQTAKLVKYSFEKLNGTSIINPKISVVNIYGGKRHCNYRILIVIV